MNKIAVELVKPRCGFALKFTTSNGEETKKIKKDEMVNGVNVGSICKQLIEKNHTTWTIEANNVADIAIDSMLQIELSK